MLGSSPDMAGVSRADLAACRRLLRGGSRSFYVASRFLPSRVRDPAIALYAFCRLADDAIDGKDAAPDALARLEDRVARAYAGRPLPIAADRAFADVVARFAIPRAVPFALLEGLAWDAAGRRYATLSDLYAYAARVAGTVGAMMALLMGQRDPEVVACACDLGIAMQFTNIARDVGEDARAGRLYLPLDWLRDAGIDPQAWLAAPAFSPQIGAVVARLLDVAEAAYERGRCGIARLPRDCRAGIHAAHLLYAEIGRQAERAGLDTVSRRTVVSTRRKIEVLARAIATPAGAAAGAWAAPHAEMRFIVDAVAAASPHRQAEADGIGWWRFDHRAVWVIDLFRRLEQLDRDEGGARSRA